MTMQFNRSAKALGVGVGILLLTLLTSVAASAFTVTATDKDGNALPVQFRWLLEEDTTNEPVVGDPTQSHLGLSFTLHSSHAPVTASGESAGFGSATIDASNAPNFDPSKRYFVSLLPHNADGSQSIYAMGGARVPVGASQVNVVLQTGLVPTAQITVHVFHDNHPLNGQYDTNRANLTNGNLDTTEDGLGGFSVIVADIAGQQIQDAFGNPLGTEYQYHPVTNQPFLNPDGSPIIALDPTSGDELIGTGIIFTDENGLARVRNIPPGKYGLQVVPPNVANPWIQTNTIEGTHTIDAWVEANEPIHFQEFGPAGPHASFGFIRETSLPADLTGGAGSIEGRIVSAHSARPPEFGFYEGLAVPDCYVGLNRTIALAGRDNVYMQPCVENGNGDSTFSITGLPDGTYQLAIFDGGLDYVFSNQLITVSSAPGGTLNHDFGLTTGNPLMVFAWFARLENVVYYDTDENGVNDDSPFFGLGEQNVNIRWRDGTIYKALPTDFVGEIPFDEVFPFFHWLVAEVDFARFKATGVTATVDAGGEILPLPSNGGDILNPQAAIDPLNPTLNDPQDAIPTSPATSDFLRTSQGPALTQAFQAFLGQTIRLEWGKANYGPNENGGISGIVFYATTRAEDDPRFAAGEEWEPGVPRVQVTLYQDADQDGDVDDRNSDTVVQLADIDNYPFDGDHFMGQPGPEDLISRVFDPLTRTVTEQSGDTAGLGYVWQYGDALAISTTDSFDDGKPTGCPPNVSQAGQGTQNPFFFHGNPGINATDDCFDGLRPFNQARDGVFDGGYAFDGVLGYNNTVPGGLIVSEEELAVTTDPDVALWDIGLPTGTYVVEAAVPEGYLPLRPEDKNVDYGDVYVPSPQILPPICVGPDHVVPNELLLFAGIGAPFAGETVELCTMKQVTVDAGPLNAAADFWVHTEVPKAGRIVGFILDDTANEFDPTSPSFGEKFGPPWIPVSIRDWTGTEVSRVYSDEYGQYNALVPSTYTVNAPSPSGVVPNMLTVCLNDPGPVDHDDNPATPDVVDPEFKKQYSQFCYTFNYQPGMTTYLDTPVVPVAAHAGPVEFPLDCEQNDGTPRIAEANGSIAGGGPVVDLNAGGAVTLTSMGVAVDVLNPNYQPETNLPNYDPVKYESRDYGFGAGTPTVYLTRESDGTTFAVDVTAASATSLTFDALTPVADPATAVDEAAMSPIGADAYQVTVVRSTGEESVVGITIEVVDATDPNTEIIRVAAGGSIQDAIDGANTGSVGSRRNVIILVEPGFYEESVILHKNVKLQGYGENTVINAVQNPAPARLVWRDKLIALEAAGEIDVLPGQPSAAEADDVLSTLIFERGFTSIEAPPIFVIGTRTAADFEVPEEFAATNGTHARIDGLRLTGADSGGGIGVNGYAPNLQISNNTIVNNTGTFGGGIRIGVNNLFGEIPGSGNPAIPGTGEDAADPRGSVNPGVTIHHNHVAENGGVSGPGGITINSGADGYEVAENFVCGNFATTAGGGIAHQGLSDGGVIRDNTIVFNEVWNGTPGAGGDGGGIAVVGNTPALINDANAVPLPQQDQQLTLGTGNLTIESNLILGNLAGAGSGGGVYMSEVNGQDIIEQPDPIDPNPAAEAPQPSAGWFSVDLTNNIIVNNVAGLMGAVFAQDAVRVDLAHNTIARNDSTATARAAMNANLLTSNAQPAGLVAMVHGDVLEANLAQHAVSTGATYSEPTTLSHNVHWENRSFSWDGGPLGQGALDATTPPNDFVSALLVASIGSDFAVMDGTSLQPDLLEPINSVVTAKGSDHVDHLSNLDSDPNFAAEYFNTHGQAPLSAQFVQPEVRPIRAGINFDEGGNFIDIGMGPLSLANDPDYHVMSPSSAIDIAGGSGTALDIDDDIRDASADAGADEAGATASLLDTDVDGVANPADNCVIRANGNQRDPNLDGYGAICDPDLNNDLITNFGDFAIFVNTFSGTYQDDVDFNGDGVVNFGDLGVMALGFGQPPGPSGVAE